MKITDIKQQVKRADRYSIFIDGKYSFSLGEAELLNSGVRVNKEVNQQELEQLKDTAQLDKLYDRALSYVALRPRSRWELEQYLKRKKSSASAKATADRPSLLIETILNKLSISGYINDVAFAEAWVSNRRLLKSTSRRRLIAELRQKHVASEVIEQVIEEDETDEQEVLKELVAKKRQQSRYQDDLKLMQYLARQGYGYGDIKEALQKESD